MLCVKLSVSILLYFIAFHFTLFRQNTMNSTVDESESLTAYQVTIYNILLPIIATIGLIANVVVILGIIFKKNLRRNIASIFIVNLAFADILVLVFSVPMWIYNFQTVDNSNDMITCQMTFGINFTVSAISLLTLAAISYDRWFAVTKPFQYHMIMTKKRAFIIVSGLWVFSLTVSMPYLIGIKASQSLSVSVIQYCVYTRVFKVEWMLVGFAIGAIIIVMNTVLYLKLLKVARQQARQIHALQCDLPPLSGQQGSANQPTRKEKNFKAAKTLGIVLGVLLVCWVPFFIVATIDILNPSFGFSAFIVKTLATITYVNSCLDPIVYTFMSRDFQKTVKRTIRRRLTIHMNGGALLENPLIHRIIDTSTS